MVFSFYLWSKTSLACGLKGTKWESLTRCNQLYITAGKTIHAHLVKADLSPSTWRRALAFRMSWWWPSCSLSYSEPSIQGQVLLLLQFTSFMPSTSPGPLLSPPGQHWPLGTYTVSPASAGSWEKTRLHPLPPYSGHLPTCDVCTSYIIQLKGLKSFCEPT